MVRKEREAPKINIFVFGFRIRKLELKIIRYSLIKMTACALLVNGLNVITFWMMTCIKEGIFLL